MSELKYTLVKGGTDGRQVQVSNYILSEPVVYQQPLPRPDADHMLVDLEYAVEKLKANIEGSRKREAGA